MRSPDWHPRTEPEMRPVCPTHNLRHNPGYSPPVERLARQRYCRRSGCPTMGRSVGGCRVARDWPRCTSLRRSAQSAATSPIDWFKCSVFQAERGNIHAVGARVRPTRTRNDSVTVPRWMVTPVVRGPRSQFLYTRHPPKTTREIPIFLPFFSPLRSRGCIQISW